VNRTIEEQWKRVASHKLAKELYVHILKQQEKCGELLKKKDSIIMRLTKQLKSKDADYAEMLRSHSVDIQTLIERIHSHFQVCDV